MVDSAKLYSWLLKLYPAGFREEYEAPMKRHFRDDYREAQGGWDKAWLWLGAIADLAVSVPAEVFHELALDLKHGLRVYRRRSLSAVLAVIALGLAIGASTGVFSVLNALLLRELPFSEPAELIEFWLSPFTPMQGRAAFTAWSRQSSYLQGATAFSSSDMNLAGGRDAVRVKVAETGSNFFYVLGVKTAVGRAFAAHEDITGQNSLAVISYSLWQEFFAGDPRIAGTILHLNGAPLTIIGVAPAAFDYPAKTAIWIPTVFDFEKIPKRGGPARQSSKLRKRRHRRKKPAAIDFSTEPIGRPGAASELGAGRYDVACAADGLRQRRSIVAFKDQRKTPGTRITSRLGSKPRETPATAHHGSHNPDDSGSLAWLGCGAMDV